MFLFPKTRIGISLIFFLSIFFTQIGIGQNCIMVCNDTINVDLDLGGFKKILPDMLLEDPTQCPDTFRVDIYVAGTSIGDTVRCDMIGEILRTEVTFLGTPQNSCESYIRIEDKSGPYISCKDTIVPCGLDPDTVMLATAIDNCDPNPILFYQDQIIDSFCIADAFNTIIHRTWGGRDNANNLSRPCRQEIRFKKPTLSDVVFQNDTTLIDTFSANITPDNIDSLVGIVPPLIEGFPIGFYCKFNVLREDQVFPICEGAFKILRKWTVVNCCTAEKREQYQMIELLDRTPPTITCQDSLVQSTSPDDCVANFILPPAIVSDDNTLAPSVKVEYPGGQLNSNGGIITGLQVGVHNILYIASDDCNNKDTCTVIVEVIDDVIPTAVCVEKLVVNINSRGQGCVPAESFDAGSTDNCRIDSIAVKRMDEPDSLFRDFLCLFCDDLPGPVMAITRFIDSTGNINECMTEVRPQDKIAPEISCAPDITIQCSVDFRDTSATGVPTAVDNCDSLRYTFRDDTTQLSLCKTGMVLRTWIVNDGAGHLDSCVQKITIEDLTPSTFINIPPDSIVYCPIDLNNLDAGEPEPVFDCEKWGLNIKDSVIVEPCTTTVQRTFTFREWCSGDDTIFFQHITVIDTSGPAWIDSVGSLNAFFNCANEVRIIGPSARDLCSATANVRQGSNIVVTGSCPDDYVQTIGFIAEDNCGNVNPDTFFVIITVRDTIPPVIEGVPNDTIANCDVNLPEPNVTVSDNCERGFLPSFIEVGLPTTCPETEKREQIWMAEDFCGNRDSVSRILTRIDTIPPTALSPTDSIYGCPEDVPPPNPEVVFGETDNCSLPVTVTLYQDDVIDNRCLDTLFRIYQLTDSCGNFSFVTHRIIIKDTIPPRVQSCPGMLTDTILTGFNLCEGIITNLTASYLDNCPGTTVSVRSDSPYADFPMSNDASGTYPLGLHRFKFYGTDECLNVNDLCEVELTVVEVDRPQVTCASEPIFVDLAANGIGELFPNQVILEAFDWCSTVEIDVFPLLFDCADYNSNALHRVDLTLASATDTFGNSGSCLPRTITLRDPLGACQAPPPAPPGFVGGIISNAMKQRIKDVKVNMTGDRNEYFMTGNFGGFQFENLDAGEHLIFEPYKNDDQLAGVSTYDLMLISRIILGETQHFSPEQFIAADINKDGAITVRDITELRKMILGLKQEFTNNNSWRFVDKKYIFKNPKNPFEEDFPEIIEQIHQNSDFELDFTGIKIGDLNNDSMADSLQEVSNRNTSLLIIEDQNFKTGETVRLKIKSSEDLLGFQFAFSFDENLLQFEKINSEITGMTDANFNFSKTEQGILSVSFTGDISKGTPIFEVVFTAKAFGNLNEVIDFNHLQLTEEVYLPDLSIKRPILDFTDPMDEGQAEISFELFQNQPNPFSNNTTIACRLKKQMNVQLEIFDMTGKKIFEDRKRLSPGIRTFEINNRFFSESGIYTYKVTTPSGIETKRMVFIKN